VNGADVLEETLNTSGTDEILNTVESVVITEHQ
jgi:hypothetical protein